MLLDYNYLKRTRLKVKLKINCLYLLFFFFFEFNFDVTILTFRFQTKFHGLFLILPGLQASSIKIAQIRQFLLRHFKEFLVLFGREIPADIEGRQFLEYEELLEVGQFVEAVVANVDNFNGQGEELFDAGEGIQFVCSQANFLQIGTL